MRNGFLLVLLAILLSGCDNSAPAARSVQSSEKSQQHHQQQQGRHEAPQVAPSATVSGHAAAKPAPAEPPDLRYLPEDAFAVLVFNARRALESQALAALPFDELLAGSLQAWNFDPREVENWLLFFTPAVEGEPLNTPYSPGAVMRFVKPVDGRKLVATRGATKEIRLGGKLCYAQAVQPATAFYLADERTIVFAAEKQLEKILSRVHRPNRLAALTTQMSREIDCHLAIDVEALTPAIDALSQANEQQLSPALAPYVRALGDVSLIHLTANLSGEQLLAAHLEAQGPEAAARLHELARQSGPLVQLGYASMRAEILRTWTEEAAQGVLGVTDSVMARAAVRYEPTSIRLDVARPPQLDHLGRRLDTALRRSPTNR